MSMEASQLPESVGVYPLSQGVDPSCFEVVLHFTSRGKNGFN